MESKQADKIINKRLDAMLYGMKARCRKTEHKAYGAYGARGISVCAEWDDKNTFKTWAKSNGYQLGLTIDRIDNDGNYCPENCRFITCSENARKKNFTLEEMDTFAHRVKHQKNGENLKEFWTVQEAASEWNVTAQSVKALINRGRVANARLQIINGRSTWVMPPQEKPTRTNKPRPAV